jgi:predicted ATPase
MINTLAIANYRSLRNVVAPLGPLNLVSGENGSGKSSLYRGLRLLADTAQGGVVASLARESGLSSTLWAGPALARLILEASNHSQLWVVSHSSRLIGALEPSERCNSLRLAKDLGETQIVGQDLLDAPSWQWPAR